jgi:hypothetical protein
MDLPPAVGKLIELAKYQIHDASDEHNIVVGGQGELDELLTAARGHSVEPLVWSQAVRGGLVGVLPQQQRTFEQSALALVRRNLSLTAELQALTSALLEAGVAVLSLKGPVIAELAYGNVGLRRFGDIDLLVKPERRAQALEIVSAAGYDSGDTPLRFLEWNRQVACYNAQKDVLAELHWGLVPRFLPKFDLDAWWERSELFPVAGVALPAPSLEDHLAFLCIHGAKHDWLSLKWAVDVAGLLVRRPDLDWDRVTRTFESFQGRRFLGLGVMLAHRLFEAPVPRSVLKRAETDAAVQTLFSVVLSSWGGSADPTRETLSGLSFSSLLLSSWPAKARLWWHAATSPTGADFDEIPLPRALHRAYALVRPLRLALKRARS